jgi:hypothetical protein
MLYQYKRILILLFIVEPLIYACGASDESEEVVEKTVEVIEEIIAVVPATPPENTMATNQAEQNKIELAAISSLSSITMEGDFNFEVQRMVSVDLHFLTTQYQEKISIYSAIDPTSNTAINLLEQGTIIQSNNYKTMLTVATPLDSLIVVRNDDFSTLVAVEIDSNGLLTHTFQE